MTLLACQAGKDVYLESPATHHLGEHAALLSVAAVHSGSFRWDCSSGAVATFKAPSTWFVPAGLAP